MILLLLLSSPVGFVFVFFVIFIYLFLAALGLHYFALVFSSYSELGLLIAMDYFLAEPRISGCAGFSSCGMGLVARGNVETSWTRG